MKNIFLYTIAIITVLSSCKNDFLNLVPQTSLSTATFFKNKAQFEQALVAAYTPLRGIVNTAIYMDEMRSDNTFFTRYAAGRGAETSLEAIAEFLDAPNLTVQPNSPGNRYATAYSGIAMVNTILDRISAVNLPLSAKDSISGEALFLRAFYYYDLAQHYGGVPLQLHEATAQGDAFQPRNTIDEVYKQIVADLNAAIPLLSAVTSFPQSGRATKGAAKMLLAYAYMSQPTKDYASAEKQLRDITQMSYTLLPNYGDVFDPKNKNNSESIFEVQYFSDLTNGQESNFAWTFLPRTLNSEAIMGYHGSGGGWNVPTQEMVDSYEPGDLRLPASVAVVEGTISGVEDFTTRGIKSPVGYTPASGVAYLYMIKKYFHPPYIADGNTPDNWPIFRYSGALLLLAECLVNEGKNTEALPYLTRVRERAGLVVPLREATRENVANEMRHELAFENHRWTDLIRNGTAIAVCNAKGGRLKALYGWLLPASFNVTETRLLYPIPSREVQLNNKLVQNPGY